MNYAHSTLPVSTQRNQINSPTIDWIQIALNHTRFCISVFDIVNNKAGMNFLGATSSDLIEPIPGQEYLTKLHKYLKTNLPRLSPQSKGPTPPTVWQQSYTLLTLGLDPSSQPLSRNVKAPLTLGFGQPSTPSKRPPPKPLQLRLPPDRLLYLLLRWQSLSQGLSHVGRTDVPIEEGVPVAARGARIDGRENVSDGDVQSVRSWVGSMRSVSMGSLATGVSKGGMGWFGKKEELNEGEPPFRSLRITYQARLACSDDSDILCLSEQRLSLCDKR